ncbi:MAG: hypothetical protein ACUVQP_04160 [Bacteroidales bacterium]
MRTSLAFVLIMLVYIIEAQELPVSLVWHERQKLEYVLQQKDSFLHMGIFPQTYHKKELDSLFVQYLMNIRYEPTPYFKNFSHHSFVQVKDKNFILHINPLINLEFSNNSIHSFSQNLRGLNISGQFEQRFRFATTMVENQAFYQDYVVQYIKKNGVVPGSGRVRGFKDGGYDFSQASGVIEFQATKHLQFLLGHSRQIVGYGYRSVLLSDAPLDYPNFRISFTKKRWQYSTTYAVFQSASAFDDRTKVYSRKYSSQHYLSFYITPKWEWAFFENTLFNAMSLRNNRPPEEFYIPIIGIHTSLYGLNHKNNVMVGTQTQLSILPKLKVYGQLAIDELKNTDSLSKNKTAWQCGIKINEPFGIKNLFMLAEYNKATRAMYVGASERETFSQHNEPIAHPLGNYFSEKLFLLHYTYKRYFISIRFNNAYYAANEKRLPQIDTTTSLTHVSQWKIESGIILHRPSRLQLAIGLHTRQETTYATTHYFYIGIHSLVYNIYDDF